MTKLWSKLCVNRSLVSRMSKWFKVAEIAIVTGIVTIRGSDGDEQTFLTLSFFKSPVRNQLSEHLDYVMRAYAYSGLLQHSHSRLVESN